MRRHAQFTILVAVAMLLPNTATAESLTEGVQYITEAAQVEYVMVEPTFIDEGSVTYTEESSSYPVDQGTVVVVDDTYTVQYEAFEPTYLEPEAKTAYGTTTTTEVIDGVVYETIISNDAPVIEGGSVSQTY